MADSSYIVTEIRFKILSEMTECYVLIESDFYLAQGWHFKAFPASRNCADLMNTEIVRAIDWPLQAP